MDSHSSLRKCQIWNLFREPSAAISIQNLTFRSQEMRSRYRKILWCDPNISTIREMRNLFRRTLIISIRQNVMAYQHTAPTPTNKCIVFIISILYCHASYIMIIKWNILWFAGPWTWNADFKALPWHPFDKMAHMVKCLTTHRNAGGRPIFFFKNIFFGNNLKQ